MRKIILLSLAASALLVGGCQKQSDESATPAVNPPATNAVPAAPATNGPMNKPGSGT